MRYLRVFLSIYSSRLGKDFSLPLFTQVLQFIGSLCFFTLHLVAFYFLLTRFHFSGWTVWESWALLFTFEIFTYTAFFLFWNGFNKTVSDINSGTLDLVVSKPISSLFVTFFRGGGVHNLVCALLGFLFLLFALVRFHLPFTFLSLLGFLFILLSSLWIFFCLCVCVISLNFKFGHLTATPGVGFEIQEVYKYPATLYSRLPFILGALVIGISLFTTLPASVLLLKSLPADYYLIYLCLLVFSTIFSRWTWQSGLHHYSSASS